MHDAKLRKKDDVKKYYQLGPEARGEVIEDYEEIDDEQIAEVANQIADRKGHDTVERERIERRMRVLAADRAPPVTRDEEEQPSTISAPANESVREQQSTRAIEEVGRGKVFFEADELSVIKVRSLLHVHILASDVVSI